MTKTIDPRMPYYKMLVLSSHPKNIARIQPFLESMRRECNVCEEVFGNILVSLTEAVTNAILHGNNGDESKTVEIRMERHGNRRLEFFIKDEGAGFNPKKIPDPTHPDNLLKIGGRGVYLMRELSDELSFHENGRVVEIDFILKNDA